MHIFGQVLISFQQAEEAPALINNLIYSETLLQSPVITACTPTGDQELVGNSRKYGVVRTHGILHGPDKQRITMAWAGRDI